MTELQGPIGIARVAYSFAQHSLSRLLEFLAFLSFNLAVINFLPIPVLDGGHLLYYFVEVLRGRPVSEQTQAIGLRIGLAMVGTLMLMALYFDLMRLW